jgi:hypothetical protein
MAGLAKQPGERPASMQEVLRALDAPEPIVLLRALEAPAPAEVLRVPPRRWRPVASIGLACGAIALLGAGLGRGHHGAQAASVGPVTAAASAGSTTASAASLAPASVREPAMGGAAGPAAGAGVALRFITSPPGASVTRTDTGQLLGQTPLEVAVERGPAPVTLRVQLAGYLPLTRQVTFDSSQRLELSLAPVTPPQRPAPLARLKRLPVREGVLDPFDE